MGELLFLLNVVVLPCTRQEVLVTTSDMHGQEVQYTAPYWLCEPGSKPAAAFAMPIGWENGNPYMREVWSAPFFSQDVEWICQPE